MSGCLKIPKGTVLIVVTAVAPPLGSLYGGVGVASRTAAEEVETGLISLVELKAFYHQCCLDFVVMKILLSEILFSYGSKTQPQGRMTLNLPQVTQPCG